MVNAVVVRLAAPLQSWGSAASSAYRPSQRVPTRSGVEGLVRAALGLGRGEPSPGWLQGARILARVDRAGTVVEDFHTVVSPPADVAELRRRASLIAHAAPVRRADFQVRRHDGAPWLVRGQVPTFVSRRMYLADAEFIVAIETEEHDLLLRALARPAFTLYLGRKACLPGFPFLLGLFAGPDTLRWLPSSSTAASLRVLELGASGTQLLERVDPPRAGDVLPAWQAARRA